MTRGDGRRPDELRPLELVPDFLGRLALDHDLPGRLPRLRMDLLADLLRRPAEQQAELRVTARSRWWNVSPGLSLRKAWMGGATDWKTCWKTSGMSCSGRRIVRHQW